MLALSGDANGLWPRKSAEGRKEGRKKWAFLRILRLLLAVDVCRWREATRRRVNWRGGRLFSIRPVRRLRDDSNFRDTSGV